MQHLDEDDQANVVQENQIWSSVCRFIEECASKGAGFSIEAPASSVMWAVRWVQPLIALAGSFFVQYDNCMQDGHRKIRRKWLTNVPELARLEAECDG